MSRTSSSTTFHSNWPRNNSRRRRKADLRLLKRPGTDMVCWGPRTAPPVRPGGTANRQVGVATRRHGRKIPLCQRIRIRSRSAARWSSSARPWGPTHRRPRGYPAPGRSNRRAASSSRAADAFAHASSSHFDKPSGPCGDRPAGAAAVGRACEADARKFCGGVKRAAQVPGCMKPHLREVGEPCMAALSKVGVKSSIVRGPRGASRQHRPM